MSKIKTITITANMCDKELLQQGTIKLLEPIKEKCNVIIPENVNNVKIVKIDNHCFINSMEIKSINILGSITFIGNNAFQNCTNLKSINIPNSIASIGESAFAGCKRLTSVNIPNSVTSIGDYAFAFASSLTSITIPDNTTFIGGHTFFNCINLKSVTMPNDIKSINFGTFADCTSLTSINIPNSVTSIDDWSFNNCKSLKEIIIPVSITYISDIHVFGNCENLTIVYEGDAEQFSKIFTSKIKDQLKKDNIPVIFVKDIKEYITYIENTSEYNIPDTSNFVRKKYLLKELDKTMGNITDLNKKIKLLTVRSNIDEQTICTNNDDVEIR